MSTRLLGLRNIFLYNFYYFANWGQSLTAWARHATTIVKLFIYCRFTKDCVELSLRIYRKSIFVFFNFANWP